jgi:hypothetical protein
MRDRLYGLRGLLNILFSIDQLAYHIYFLFTLRGGAPSMMNSAKMRLD